VLDAISRVKSGEASNAVLFRIMLVIIAYKLYAILVVIMFIKEVVAERQIGASALYTNIIVEPTDEYLPTQFQHQNIYCTTVLPNTQYVNSKSSALDNSSDVV